MVNHKARRNRNDNNLKNRNKHAGHIYIHTGSRIHIGKEGRQKRRKNRGNRGHAHGQRHVALREVGHHVRGCAAGAGSHQDDANGQLRGKPEHLCQSEGQKGHHRKLSNTSDNYILRPAEHHLKILRLQGKSHTEHNHAQQRVDIAGLQKAYGLRRKQGDGRDHNDDNRHISADKICDFL